MLCPPHRNMFPFPKLGSHCFPIVLLLLLWFAWKIYSAVEMMIRIPVVMTGEAESWPCEELMYCSRANVWQEWGFTELCSGLRTAFWFCARIDSKRQSTVERGISGEHAGARFVYNIRDPGFRTNWLCPCQWGREEGEEKAHEQDKTELLWLMSGSPPATQAMFVPSNTGLVLLRSCFFLIILFPFLLFLFFPVFFLPFLKQALDTDWKRKLVEGI